MGKEVCSSLCGIAGIVIAHTLSIAVLVESAAGISVVLILFVEEVVDGTAYCGRLYVWQLECIGEVQVAYEICVEHVVFTIGITHVLLADVLGL